jgi:DinB superfamily
MFVAEARAMTTEHEHNVLDPWPGAFDVEVGRWLTAFADVRRGTERLLDAFEPEDIDRDPGDGGDTLGSVLHHVASVEIAWLYIDILDRRDDIDRRRWPYDSREADGRLTIVRGETLAQHRERLAEARAEVVGIIAAMSNETPRTAR